MQPVDATSLPWICRADASHCAVLVSGDGHTGPGSFMLVRYPRERDATWCAFLCSRHAGEVGPLAEPLDAIAAAELTDRRTQHALAMAGKRFRQPVPLQIR